MVIYIYILSCDWLYYINIYLEIFILEHYSGDVEGVLIENNGGVVEGRRRDDGGNGMWRPADVEGSGRHLMMWMLMLLLLMMMMMFMGHMMWPLVIPHLFARAWYRCWGFPCRRSLSSYPHLQWICTPPRYRAVAS